MSKKSNTSNNNSMMFSLDERSVEEFTENSDGRSGILGHQEQIPQEPCKTIAALIFFLGGALSAAVSLAATHDRLPATAPLPDIVHEHVSYQKWGLDWCEYLLLLSTLTAISVVLLHQHRFIVIRRIFLLLGILYYYRSLCFWVTVVPKADIHYHCNNRSDDVSMTGEF